MFARLFCLCLSLYKGGTKLTITSSYIRFVSDEAHISFIERNNNVEKTIKFSEFKEVEVDEEEEDVQPNAPVLYGIECVSPCLMLQDDEDHGGDEDDMNPLDKAYIALLLDGISQPIDSYLFEAGLFDEVLIETPIAKGASVIGSEITAMASGLVDSDICILRIRSADSGEYVDVDGEIGEDLTSLSFILPEEVREIFPGNGSKSGAYHLDVSIDGSTFDEMESPGFLIKH